MKISGFKGFLVVWLGQFVSIFGSGLTRFALTLWIYQETGSATALSLSGFFALAPMIVLMPLGGAMADRLNRKKVLIVSDMVSAFATAALLILFYTGQLNIWHLYLVNILSSASEAFQYPAFMAAMGMIVPQEHFSRANGMRDLARSASSIFAPLAAGALLAFIDIGQIMTIDLVTFAAAIFALSIVHIPQPEKSEEAKSQASLRQDILYGFKFVWERPSLLGLQSTMLTLNFFATMVGILVPALVLSRTDNNELVLGSIRSIMSFGALAGGVVISAWGGPKRRIHGILMSGILAALLGRVLFGLGRSFVTWIPGAFFLYFFIPINNGSSGAIWMSKTPPDVQGRVLAMRRFAAQISNPIGALLAGPLADKIFEPAMMPGGALASIFGGLVGTGPGTGMSLMFILAGLATLCLSLLVYFIPAVWNVEDILPDHTPTQPSHSAEKEVELDDKQAPRRLAPAD
jgi:MFS family permease